MSRGSMLSVNYGFQNAVLGSESSYPTLARAAMAASPAHCPKIEWLFDPIQCDGDKLTAWWNWAQIVRTPFSAGSSIDESLHTHLAAVEDTLLNGKRRQDESRYQVRYCGGAIEFLGREPDLGDTLILRPLRDLVLAFDRGGRLGTRTNEWLSEFSLQVIPA